MYLIWRRLFAPAYLGLLFFFSFVSCSFTFLLIHFLEYSNPWALASYMSIQDAHCVCIYDYLVFSCSTEFSILSSLLWKQENETPGWTQLKLPGQAPSPRCGHTITSGGHYVSDICFKCFYVWYTFFMDDIYFITLQFTFVLLCYYGETG